MFEKVAETYGKLDKSINNDFEKELVDNGYKWFVDSYKNSIRGFQMSAVGTGNAFIMGSAEFATPIPFVDKLKMQFLDNVRLTCFVDAGKIFNPTISDTLYDRPMQAITAGVGMKIYIPGLGPLSVDYGIPLTNPGGSGSRNGYFTFGVGDMMY